MSRIRLKPPCKSHFMHTHYHIPMIQTATVMKEAYETEGVKMLWMRTGVKQRPSLRIEAHGEWLVKTP